MTMIPASQLYLAAACVLAGIVFGFGYFAALRVTATWLVEGRASFAPALLTVGRLGAAVALFAAAALLGAPALLGAFAGFLVARALALRSARHRP